MITPGQNQSTAIKDRSWESYNSLLEKVIVLTKEDSLSDLMIVPDNAGPTPYVMASEFSSKVFRLVNYLYEEYVDDITLTYPTSPSASRNPTTSPSLSQTFSQNQSTEINIEFNQTLTFFNDAITSAKSEYKEGTKERNFLDTLKTGIQAARSAVDLVKIVLTTSAQYGITLELLQHMLNIH